MKAKTGKDVAFAAGLLQKGKLVAIPTETVYGLAANAFDLEAVAAIFSAKNRPFFDPLILHCPDKEVAFSLFKEFPSEFNKLADAFWAGALTLVAPKSDKVPDLITAGSPLVAVRVPAHSLTLDLLNRAGFALAAPSANPFGYVSPTTAQHVADQLGNKIDYILDGGKCEVGIESTIVGIRKGKIQIWRLGGIEKEEIEKVLGYEIELHIHKNSNPDTAGQMDKHYSPHAKMRLFSPHEFEYAVLSLSQTKRQQTALLTFGKTEDFSEFGKIRNLSPSASFVEAAQNLYAFIRESDVPQIQEIWAIQLPDTGLGKAINDRLERAAAK